MKFIKVLAWAMCSLVVTVTAAAADYPAPKEADWVARDFRFHTGEVLPEVRLHYRTIGVPTGEPVLVLHGTAGSGATLLNPGFAGELFGPGQPLDASRYYIILPDALGTGKSTRPSDGLRTRFRRYNYDDMVLAQRLAQPFRGDANDVMYQWESSDDYNPSPGLEGIQAMLLAINSGDDERNPPELGVMDAEIKRVKNGSYVIIPASAETRGHLTTGMAKFWKHHLAELLQAAPRKAQ